MGDKAGGGAEPPDGGTGTGVSKYIDLPRQSYPPELRLRVGGVQPVLGVSSEEIEPVVGRTLDPFRGLSSGQVQAHQRVDVRGALNAEVDAPGGAVADQHPPVLIHMTIASRYQRRCAAGWIEQVALL